MAAEPAPEPDTETIVRHVLPQRIDAVGFGLSLLHHDVREIRRRQDEDRLLLESYGDLLRSHGGMLEEILRRLPPAPDDGE